MITPPDHALMVDPSTPMQHVVRKVWLQRLAADLVLYGHDQPLTLANAYGLTIDQLEDLYDDLDLIRYIDAAATTASSVRGQAQLAAQSAMFANIRTLHELAVDPAAEAKDRISAIKELKDIAASGDKIAVAAAAALGDQTRAPALVLNIGVPGSAGAITVDMARPAEIAGE
jgi:hypothetical protein